MPKDTDFFELAFRLRITGNEVRRVRDQNAKDLGLTSAQADAMMVISKSPNCHIVDLCTALGTSHQAACTLIERLKDKGLVEVSASRSDARAKDIKLTYKGEAILASFLERGLKRNGAMLSGFTDHEVADLRRMLDRIQYNLRGCDST